MYAADILNMIITTTLLYATLTSATISLSSFQIAAGFSQGCTDAYNAAIDGCDPSNFSQNCSEQCFLALAQAQVTIENACAQQQAPPNSIIGQFFLGNGPTFMCTQDFGPLFAAGGGPPSGSMSSSSVTSSTDTASATKTKETKSTTISHVSTTSSTTHRTTTVSETSTSSSSSPTTSQHGSQHTSTFLTTAFNNGVATTISSQAQRTAAANSNPDAFGGGGSPFEVGPNGSSKSSNGGERQGAGKAGKADFWILLSVVFGVLAC